jgi:hypothetical protein
VPVKAVTGRWAYQARGEFSEADLGHFGFTVGLPVPRVFGYT